ncbi:esterase [Leifsonia xyli subsp. xyli]|uniref:SGNH hydrolase-type esterase domain-containing protein n=2 Tax=Leifsonia xyli subsp. xyli TaxID=59736 RepID=Q6ACS0_LEIXX|nr:SGNH/GDSL hydrolase family protein [Leifsonia xyli]AAT89823.1 conserved hypothetical protein [Leifsonia xyli subsp. xyli str. CTCB07]ODA90161.1 esterase [Leifsonia xyli subsp. xyli]
MGNRKPFFAASAIIAAAVCAAVWSFAVRKHAAVAAGRVRLTETLPIHSQWWRDAAKHEGDILYVAIGGRAAQGIGASTPENSYVGIIAGHLRSVTGRSVRVVNLSVSGATVALAVADQLPRLTGYEPGIATVSIGANDIAGFDPAVFRAGIQRVFGALPSDALIADLPYFFLPKNERKVAVANAILREEAATRGLTVVPLHETMRRQGLRGVFTQFADDLFHPNDHGYRVWASAFLPAVTALAARKFPRQRPVETGSTPETHSVRTAEGSATLSA